MLFAACTPAATPTAAPAAATGAPAAAATNGELKIAVLAPLSGSVPTFGLSTKEGALLAVDQWNAKGGVLGMKVVADVEDSQCNPDPAVNAANKVINQDNIHYIIGEVCSKASIPVSEIANPAKVVMISTASTNSSVTVDAKGVVKDYIFRACFIDPFQGKVGATFAFNTLKAKTAFIMEDQSNDYVKGLGEAFDSAFTALGGKVVGKENYTGKDTDFSAILSKIADAKPDMVYLPDYYNVVNLVMGQAKQKGITVPFMGGDGWDSPDLDAKAADGGYFTNHYSAQDTSPVVQNFLKDYGAAYKDDKGQPKVPDALAALAYDATNEMLQAITNAKADDTTKVRDALVAINFQGVTGNITYDAQHNPIKAAVIMQVKDGKVSFNSSVAP
jgi:branched-chain amino acid transport system substrate-binding protein